MKMRKVFFVVISIFLLLGMIGCVAEDPVFDASLSASPSTFSQAGETITFAYTAKNPNEEMRVQIEDEKFGLICDEFYLHPYGVEQVCTYNYITTAADVAAGGITNTATFLASEETQNGCYLTPATSSQSVSASVGFVASADTAPIESSGWTIATAGCDRETDQMGFSINTGYTWLTQATQVSYIATDTETEYTCETGTTPGMVHCRGSHSQDPGTLTFCLQRSTDDAPTCAAFTDFPSWIVGISCAPDWDISYAACDGPTQVYFVIDMHYEWLDNSGIYGYTANDGQTEYWCDTSDNAGMVYCYGAKTTVTGPLEFCFQRPEDTAPLCQTFDNFPAKINMLSCAPTATVAPACSAITSISTCQNTPGCYWDTSPNKCVKK